MEIFGDGGTQFDPRIVEALIAVAASARPVPLNLAPAA